MDKTQIDLVEYVDRIIYPVSKEELINGLLVQNAPREAVSLIERLPQPRYSSAATVLSDLEDITSVEPHEVTGASQYSDFLELVIRNVGDVAHVTKDIYNRVVTQVVRAAHEQGALSIDESVAMERRLKASFADLRGSMSEVTDDGAPTDPLDDLPRIRT